MDPRCRLADGPYLGSAFYASNETYDGFHTCNTWTALLLRQAGFPMNPHVLFADQVMRQVHAMAARQARPEVISRAAPCRSGRRTVEPGGTTTVVCDGGGGSLLLKLRHPPRSSVRSKGNRRIGHPRQRSDQDG